MARSWAEPRGHGQPISIWSTAKGDGEEVAQRADREPLRPQSRDNLLSSYATIHAHERA
jgi:hypothetical protein